MDAWQQQQSAYAMDPSSMSSRAGAGVPMDPTEAKRDKRRRDMMERVERLRRDTIDRKDSIYSDLQGSFNLALGAMLSTPHPTHPEYLLRLFAQSVARDAEVLEERLSSTYAFETAQQLYHNEVERIEEEYQAAKRAIKDKLHEACNEREKRLREEKDSLDVVGLSESMYGDHLGHGKHATRRRGPPVSASAINMAAAASSANGSGGGGGGGGSTSSATNGGAAAATLGVGITGVALPLPDPLPSSSGNQASASAAMAKTTSNPGTPSTSFAAASHALQPNLTSGNISDPFNYSLLPASPALANNALHPSMLLLQPNSSALVQNLKTSSTLGGGGAAGNGGGGAAGVAGGNGGGAASLLPTHRSTTGVGGRTKAGYPPNGLVITPGTYAVFGKSITAINSLRSEEVADDMEGIRHLGKKRRRGAGGEGTSSRRQRAAAMQEAF